MGYTCPLPVSALCCLLVLPFSPCAVCLFHCSLHLQLPGLRLQSIYRGAHLQIERYVGEEEFAADEGLSFRPSGAGEGQVILKRHGGHVLKIIALGSRALSPATDLGMFRWVRNPQAPGAEHVYSLLGGTSA